jgi:hypothetical protein
MPVNDLLRIAAVCTLEETVLLACVANVGANEGGDKGTVSPMKL